MPYPSAEPDRLILAMELAGKGLIPTQGKQHFSRDKINNMVQAMENGTFDWRAAGLRPVLLGPKGEVLGGHHRLVAAHLAGIDLDSMPGQVIQYPIAFRDVLFRWDQVLPDV